MAMSPRKQMASPKIKRVPVKLKCGGGVKKMRGGGMVKKFRGGGMVKKNGR